MPDQKIQTSLHGHRIGLSAKNDLIMDKSNGGLNGAAGMRYAELHPLLVARGQLTSAQILAMNATPISVIAAPGAGYATLVMGALFFLDYGGTGYTAGAGEDLILSYTDGSGSLVVLPIDGADFLDQTADTIAYTPGMVQADSQGVVLTENAAIVASIQSGEIITGNSPINYEIYYRVVPATLPAA